MRKYIAFVLALVCVLGLVGCSNAQNGNTPATGEEKSDLTANAAILEEATAWFEQQTTDYEIICGEVHDDAVVFLTGTKKPGTDSYQFLQAFVVNKNDEGYEVTAMKDGERAMSAGIVAHVLAANGLTVVFGDTGDSIFDFINDRRIEADFTRVSILLKNGETKDREITGNAPYLLVFPEALEITDIEFVSSELTVKYSSFYGETLMDDTASYDFSNIFE